MILKFKEIHLSIEKFNSINLADFTVLTGENGSGKSHLLQAIKNGKVSIDSYPVNNIVLFNYETFKLDNEPKFNGQTLIQESETAWNYHNKTIKMQALNWKNTLGQDYPQIKEKCETENIGLFNLEDDKINKYKQQVTNFFSQNNIRSNQQAQGIYSIVKNLPHSIDEINHEDFVELYKPFTVKNDFLPIQLGKVFWDYYLKYRNNEINEFENEKYEIKHKVLTEDQFFKIHGQKPWIVINEILQKFDSLKYEVASPEGINYFGSFQLSLKHTEKPNLNIGFESLSSGERTLMALVASVYKSAEDRQFPDVLLLDEVDASLHPSMMKNMLDVISSIFLKHGVKIILITHSPTTIALAPDESIFVMNRSGFNRIAKKSKQEALSILTQGYATIDEGLKLFDEITKSKITLITEGYNTKLISLVLELYNITEISVLEGIENITGKTQLKTIFNFLSKTNHKNKVIFVWDCDVKYQIEEENNTFPYFFPLNENNSIAKKGIENAFPENLFDNFKKTIIRSNGNQLIEFDSNSKRDFEKFIISRKNKEDFKHFEPLIEEIIRIKAIKI